MPLTLVNHGPMTLRLPVGLPLCQLLVVQLAGAVDADYAQRGDRKYLDDVGGPSYWWRDALVREIRNSVGTSVTERVFDELDEVFVKNDDEVLERLEQFLAQGRRNYGNADDLLDEFARVEGQARNRRRLQQFIGQWSWTVTAPIAAALWIAGATVWAAIPATVVAIGSGLAVARALKTDVPYYVTPRELDQLRRIRSERTASVDNGAGGT